MQFLAWLKTVRGSRLGAACLVAAAEASLNLAAVWAGLVRLGSGAVELTVTGVASGGLAGPLKAAALAVEVKAERDAAAFSDFSTTCWVFFAFRRSAVVLEFMSAFSWCSLETGRKQLAFVARDGAALLETIVPALPLSAVIFFKSLLDGGGSSVVPEVAALVTATAAVSNDGCAPVFSEISTSISITCQQKHQG